MAGGGESWEWLRRGLSTDAPTPRQHCRNNTSEHPWESQDSYLPCPWQRGGKCPHASLSPDPGILERGCGQMREGWGRQAAKRQGARRRMGWTAALCAEVYVTLSTAMRRKQSEISRELLPVEAGAQDIDVCILHARCLCTEGRQQMKQNCGGSHQCPTLPLYMGHFPPQQLPPSLCLRLSLTSKILIVHPHRRQDYGKLTP